MADFAARRTIMVDTQVRPSDVTKFPIIEAMVNVPREAFVPDQMREAAYVGENLDLGEGRVVLEPRTLGKMLDGLNIQPDELVLDLGCGLGYSSAIIARLAEAVIAVELPDRAEDAQRLLVENGADNVAVIGGNLADGAAKHGPYDVIVLQGGAEQIPPVLLEQLKDGGRIGAVFMEGGLGVCQIGYKVDGNINWRFSFNATAPVVEGFEKQNEFTF
ncbi:MAG: protein-L-isoaspartate O-methyltransferase [Marinosulfonomonas sp.]|nr:protein-L-isoaspartate O-methyltransferase [Marinosulfonomonas sp.]